MKNYYEILEVSENASKEIIEKAYRVLSKKYHPDLQEESKKEKSKIKMQEINEAYEVLKDSLKREEYDNKLKEERNFETKKREQEILEAQRNEFERYKESISKEKSDFSKVDDYEEEKNKKIKRQQQEFQRQEYEMQEEQEKIKNEYRQQYQDAYEDYLRSLGYKIKYKWTWKKTKELLISIAIMAIIAIAVWYFPPTHKFLIEFYNSNKIVHIFVDLIINFLDILKNIFIEFFSNLKIK